MTLDLDAITKRHTDKETAREMLTSTAIQGPALGKLQTYAVTAAVSADDVPALVARVRELEQHLADARSALDNSQITEADLVNARREARIHGIPEASRGDYGWVFTIGYVRGYRAAAEVCWQAQQTDTTGEFAAHWHRAHGRGPTP